MTDVRLPASWAFLLAHLLTCGLNPDWSLTGSVAIPCYAPGSPVNVYLGGDMAYQQAAWGSALNAGKLP